MIQRGKKGNKRGADSQDLLQILNEGEKDGWLLREMGQMAGTGNLLTPKTRWGGQRGAGAHTAVKLR